MGGEESYTWATEVERLFLFRKKKETFSEEEEIEREIWRERERRSFLEQEGQKH